MQTAHNVYFCKENKIRWSVLQQFQELLTHMQKAALYRGENVQLFEEPDFVVGLDKALLRQLNQQVRQDPGVELPEGFYKVYEKDQFFEYSLPEYLPEAQRVATETLDALLFDLFGVHFLEARAYTAVVPKVKQEQRIAAGKHKKNLDEVKSRTQQKSTTFAIKTDPL